MHLFAVLFEKVRGNPNDEPLFWKYAKIASERSRAQLSQPISHIFMKSGSSFGLPPVFSVFPFEDAEVTLKKSPPTLLLLLPIPPCQQIDTFGLLIAKPVSVY